VSYKSTAVESAPRGFEAKQTYADWLNGYSWDSFLTATFKRPRKEPYYALQSVWRVIHEQGVGRAFLCAEPHQSGDLHIHGIMSGLVKTMSGESHYQGDQAVWSRLFNTFGRAKVEPVRSCEDVAGYCAKYILKEQTRAADYYEVFGTRKQWLNGCRNEN
jgi:hypothetical protein